MSDDIEKTVSEKHSIRHFALQVDESIYVSGKAQILGFVRFINENKIVNQYLCCKELAEPTTLHREAFVLKTLPEELKPVLDFIYLFYFF